jgi:hypothetical protein
VWKAIFLTVFINTSHLSNSLLCKSAVHDSPLCSRPAGWGTWTCGRLLYCRQGKDKAPVIWTKSKALSDPRQMGQRFPSWSCPKMLWTRHRVHHHYVTYTTARSHRG